jgi:protein ImuA
MSQNPMRPTRGAPPPVIPGLRRGRDLDAPERGEGPPPLRPGRLHEVAGPAAPAFAALQAGLRRGPVIWVLPPRPAERPDGFGLAAFFDPARLILVEALQPLDVYWAMEEALRSGAAPLVVAEPTAPPGLTQSRRLQLAAEAGGGVGLLRLPESALAAHDAAETRWRASGRAADPAGAPRWRWECRKNKRGPLGAWTLGWDPGRRALLPEPRAEAPAA